MGNHALIDADIILHRAAYFSTLAEDGSEPIFSASVGIETAKIMIKEWMEAAKSVSCTVVLSDRRFEKCTWRYSVFPDYKSNRKTEKPPHFWEIEEYLRGREDALTMNGLEADDAIGILHTKDPGGTVMVSIDKDFLSVPGRLYNPDKNPKEQLTFTTTNEADLAWVRQALGGDAVDGYKGAKGIGPGKARKIIEPGMSLREAIMAAYVIFQQKGHSLEYIWQQFMCARILRCTDYDLEFGNISIKSPVAGGIWFEASAKFLKGDE